MKKIATTLIAARWHPKSTSVSRVLQEYILAARISLMLAVPREISLSSQFAHLFYSSIQACLSETKFYQLCAHTKQQQKIEKKRNIVPSEKVFAGNSFVE